LIFTFENNEPPDFTLDIEFGTLDPQTIYESKTEFQHLENQRYDEWIKMSDEEKDITREMVKASLNRLIEQIDTWLPYGYWNEGNMYADFKVRVLMSERQRFQRAEDIKEQKEIAEAVRGTQKILEELQQNK
jgi:hypothetical protein